MKGKEGKIFYFEEPGGGNTEKVLDVVCERMEEGDIKNGVVASSRGGTGLQFAKRIAKETNLVVVSIHPGYTKPGVWLFDRKILKELESMCVTVVRQSHVLSGLERSFTSKFSGVSHSEVLAESLRSLFGVGLKVAIECTIMAADSGAIALNKTIAVGGTEGRGADCAIVVAPSHCNNFFDFRVLEILAKPFRRDGLKKQGG